jgi:hypothetical protein
MRSVPRHYSPVKELIIADNVGAAVKSYMHLAVSIDSAVADILPGCYFLGGDKDRAKDKKQNYRKFIQLPPHFIHKVHSHPRNNDILHFIS